MIQVSKSALKARMLEYFRQVEETGDELIVTDHRRPVLKVSRIATVQSVAELFADVRGHAKLSEASVLAPETESWEESLP